MQQLTGILVVNQNLLLYRIFKIKLLFLTQLLTQKKEYEKRTIKRQVCKIRIDKR